MRVRVDMLFEEIETVSKKKTIQTDLITIAELDFGDVVLKGVKIDEGSPEANAEAVKNLTAIAGTSKNTNTSTQKLSEIIEQYIVDTVSNEKWNEKTKNQNIATLNLLVEVIGDKHASDIAHDDLKNFGQIIRKLPANKNKNPIFKNKNVKQILKLAPPPMSSTTVTNHFRRVKTFFQWTVDNGIFSQNYSSPLRTPKKSSSKSRRPFTEEELRLLFNGDVYKGKKPSGARKWHYSTFWLPLIAAFTGARLEEISQLHVTDIITIDGITCFDINDNDEKSVKTSAGSRVIPIHSMLIKIGFPEFINELKKLKHKRLFPELNKTKTKGFGDQVTKQFHTYRKSLGIIAKDGEPKIVFHSFRHTANSLLAHKGVHEEERSAIIGHESGRSVNRRVYTDKYPPNVTQPIIEMIQYNIDLSHISYAWYKSNRFRWYKRKTVQK